MNILYFGDDFASSTAYHRSQALVRIGHSVTIYSPNKIYNAYVTNSFITHLHFRTGFVFLQPFFRKWLNSIVKTKNTKYELIWVDSGEFFDRECLKLLQKLNCPIVLYNHDDHI